MRLRQLNNVVLPAPFGPISPRISPSSISKETPSSATIPPNRNATSQTSSSLVPSVRPIMGISRWSSSTRPVVRASALAIATPACNEPDDLHFSSQAERAFRKVKGVIVFLAMITILKLPDSHYISQPMAVRSCAGWTKEVPMVDGTSSSPPRRAAFEDRSLHARTPPTAHPTPGRLAFQPLRELLLQICCRCNNPQ